MYTKIIVALSLEHGIGQRAMQVARKLLAPGGKIIALHVYAPPPGSVSAYLDDEVVKKAFRAAEAALAERVAGEPDIEPVLVKGHPGRTIPDYAAEVGADCIVVGSQAPGLADILLGSTAARVVRHAPCSVHVVR